MPRVFVPAALRSMTLGSEEVVVGGATIRAVIEQLERRFPGIRQHLCDGEFLRPGLAVAVGNSVSSLGLLQPVQAEDEVHFVTAIGGG